MNKIKNCESGAGLVEVLIAVGIMGIVMMGMTSMFDSQRQQLRILSQKQDLIDLKNIMLNQLSKASVCTWQLKNKQINNASPTSPTSFSPTVLTFTGNTIYSGINAASAPLAVEGAPIPNSLNGVVIESVRFKDIYATGNTNEYRGVIEVAFAPASLQMMLKPIQQPVIIKTLGPPSTTDVIDSCYGVDSNSAFGAFQMRTVNTDYLADTDGLVLMTVWGTPTDRQTTIRAMVDGIQIAEIGTVDQTAISSEGPQSLTIPVPKGKVWRLNLVYGIPANTIVRWMPIGQP